MSRIRVALVSLGALAIVALLAFPPFMVIDRAAPETRHSGLGHHPAWRPPTAAAAEEVLRQKIGMPSPGVGSSPDVGRNSVLLTLEIVLILVGTSTAWLLLGRRARSRADAWNEIFKHSEEIFTEPHEDIPEIVRLLKDREASTVLDLGCGTGRHVLYLAQSGFSVFGLDRSPEGIRVTGELLAEEGLAADLKMQSMTQPFPYEDRFFDAVISVQVIHHAEMATIRRIVREISRVLKPGGFLFVTVPELKDGRPRSVWAKEFEQIEPHTFIPLDGPERGLAHHYFTAEELREELSGFDIADIHLDTVNHHCLSAFKR